MKKTCETLENLNLNQYCVHEKERNRNNNKYILTQNSF